MLKPQVITIIGHHMKKSIIKKENTKYGKLNLQKLYTSRLYLSIKEL